MNTINSYALSSLTPFKLLDKTIIYSKHIKTWKTNQILLQDLSNDYIKIIAGSSCVIALSYDSPGDFIPVVKKHEIMWVKLNPSKNIHAKSLSFDFVKGLLFDLELITSNHEIVELEIRYWKKS